MISGRIFHILGSVMDTIGMNHGGSKDFHLAQDGIGTIIWLLRTMSLHSQLQVAVVLPSSSRMEN